MFFLNLKVENQKSKSKNEKSKFQKGKSITEMFLPKIFGCLRISLYLCGVFFMGFIKLSSAVVVVKRWRFFFMRACAHVREK